MCVCPFQAIYVQGKSSLTESRYRSVVKSWSTGAKNVSSLSQLPLPVEKCSKRLMGRRGAFLGKILTQNLNLNSGVVLLKEVRKATEN